MLGLVCSLLDKSIILYYTELSENEYHTCGSILIDALYQRIQLDSSSLSLLQLSINIM